MFVGDFLYFLYFCIFVLFFIFIFPDSVFWLKVADRRQAAAAEVLTRSAVRKQKEKLGHVQCAPFSTFSPKRGAKLGQCVSVANERTNVAKILNFEWH